jgi:hypothetical protein
MRKPHEGVNKRVYFFFHMLMFLAYFVRLDWIRLEAIKKTLNIPGNSVYRDIHFLSQKSKQYVYDMAKGLHALSYQRAIEGLGLSLTAAWDKFNDKSINEKQRVAYLRPIKEINESMMQLTINECYGSSRHNKTC